MSVEWIKELCPEIHDWQAKMIAEHWNNAVVAEREACLKLCDTNEFFGRFGYDDQDAIKAAIRARGETK
jgi:hypothetical protein